jgi:hypothetical protein
LAAVADALAAVLEGAAAAEVGAAALSCFQLLCLPVGSSEGVAKLLLSVEVESEEVTSAVEVAKLLARVEVEVASAEVAAGESAASAEQAELGLGRHAAQKVALDPVEFVALVVVAHELLHEHCTDCRCRLPPSKHGGSRSCM